MIFILQQLLFFTVLLESGTSSKDSLGNETICQFFDLMEEENDIESDLYEEELEEEKKLFAIFLDHTKPSGDNPFSRILLRQSNLFKPQIYSPPDISI